MTTLQAQLAALNGTAGKHPGSTYAQNRRHDEAVGRGIDYSVFHGQVVYHRGLRSRATILYASPREAADVPLATLEEYCQDALIDLSEDLPSLYSAIDILCGHGEASNSHIQQTLIRLTILLGENDEKITQNCLRVLEYMLRRYEIHRYMMEHLVWTFLPHHQQLPNLWHRCLALVDLASHPSYLWLRPYADLNRPAPTPRELCARHIMQEIPLLRKLCDLVSKIASEKAFEYDQPNTPLRGWSHVFSWTAACLVDGLVWQQEAPQHALDRVAMARILVPAVRQALRKAEKEDHCSWACIVASTMAECLDLSSNVIAKWGRALLHNVAAMNPIMAWSALASILLAGQDPQNVDEESYLCLIQPHDQWIGCPLPPKLYAAIKPDCALHLGNLYKTQRLEVSPLLVAILVRALNANHVKLATALLEDNQLTELWKRHFIVESVAALIVQSVINRNSSIGLETGRVVLKCLSDTFSRTVVENGVAHAATKVEVSKLQPLLDGIVAMVQADPDPETAEDTSMLPPRVALEHPDVQVRRRALKQLTGDGSSNQAWTGDDYDIMDDGESLVETLIRRWGLEPNFGLAKEFAKALINTSMPLVGEDGIDKQCEAVLSATYRWVETNNHGMSKLASKIVDKVVQDAELLGASGPTFQLLLELSLSLIALTEAPQSSRVKQCLGNPVFWENLAENFKSKPKVTTELQVRHRCTLTALKAIAENSVEKKEFADKYLQVFTQMVRARSRVIDKSQKELLEASLARIVASISDSPLHAVNGIVKLAGLPDQQVLDFVSPMIQRLASNLTDSSGNKVDTLCVLVEAATRATTPLSSVKRLIGISKSLIADGSGPICLVIVPLFALVSHADRGVREASIDAMSAILANSKKQDSYLSSILPLCHMACNESTTFGKLGADLESFLARCMQQIDSNTTRDVLMDLVLHALFTTSKLVTEKALSSFEASSWIPDDPGSGTRAAGCRVFEAMELAGEHAFALSLRWKNVGTFVFDWMIKMETTLKCKVEFPRVSELLARLLKGVVVSGHQVVISSGPRGGGIRSRSYSVGNVGVEIVRPYPEEMVHAVQQAIESSQYLQKTVVDQVISSSSWSGYVFPILESNDRKSIVRSLLKLGSNSDSLKRAGLSLPLDSLEVAEIVEEVEIIDHNFPYLAVLLDYLKANASRLAGKKGTCDLLGSIFSKIQTMSMLDESVENDSVEFLLLSSLGVVRDLLGDELVGFASHKLSQWVDIIIALLGAPRKPEFGVVRLVKTMRGRSICFGILAALASLEPEAVVESVAELVLKLLSMTDTFSLEEARAGISVSLPIFWSKVSSSSRTITSLVKDLLQLIISRPVDERNLLLKDLVKAMNGAEVVDEEYRNVSPGIVSIIFVASATNAMSGAEAKEVALMIFEASPPASQIASLPFLTAISRQLMGHLLGSPDSEDPCQYIPSSSEIMDIVKSSLIPDSGTTNELGILSAILQLVNEAVLLDNVRKVMRNRNSPLAAALVQLWQNIILMHSIADTAGSSSDVTNPSDSASWRRITSVTEGCREVVEENLPASVFIAAVRSLLKERTGAGLRSRALRLAADRVLHYDSQSRDKPVFIEFLSDAREMMKSQSYSALDRQGALIYVEHATRTLFYSTASEKAEKVVFQRLGPVLADCCDVIKHILESNEELEELDEGTLHLLASAALATATLVRTIGVKALPKVSGILKPMLKLLSVINSSSKLSVAVAVEAGEHSTAALIQIGILRFLLSAIETVPQSVFSDLRSLLSESIMFSDAMRASTDSVVIATLESVDVALTSRIPSRLMIPALVKLIASGKTKLVRYVLGMLTKSVALLEPTEGGIFRVAVLRAVLRAYDSNGNGEEGSFLPEAANRCLLQLVLKLSELQFRKMFGDLFEWMKEKPSKRMFAFWTICEAFSKELSAIFLPCAGMVFEKLVEDLTVLADGTSSSRAGVELLQKGRKKRKKTGTTGKFLENDEQLSLLPLLGTVHGVLRADAQNGGKWIREHGRYHALLEPLCRFLQCRVPEKFPSPETHQSRFEFLVEENTRGSVIDCLTSLALAAGDEQLWKALNHSVLEACGHTERAEVRKAGVHCLISLIRSLGEEYMVLLPECLPVLAELLEDESEVVAGLARDAVTMAEDLLGESLEANLS